MANYQSPTWVNNQAPKLNAENLQALTDTVEASQILRGTGAPGSTTAAVVGQKYVDESTVPNTVYTCTAAENGSYTWGKDPTRAEIDKVTEITNTAYESFATDTAAGTPASFSDGADGVPVKDLKLEITPVQEGSGDPSPDNIRPISGRTALKYAQTGKNIIPAFKSSPTSGGVTVTPNADGSFTMSGTASADAAMFYLPLPCSLPKGSRVTISMNNDAVNEQVGVRFANGDTSPIGYGVSILADAVNKTAGHTITVKATALNVFVLRNHDDVPEITMKIQVEFGETASAWEPYAGAGTSVSFPAEAGTVYGGTLDVTTGVLTVEQTLVTVGAEYSIGGISSIVQHGTDTAFWLNLGSGVYMLNKPMNSKCNQATFVTGSIAAAPSNSFGVSNTYLHSAWVRMPTATVGTTVESIHAYVSEHPLEFAVGRAEPMTYQLTPAELRTLLGDNSFWSDAGDAAVEYRANPNLYLDKRLAALAANLAAVEGGAAASRNYAAGDFLVFGGVLYKVSTAIAVGEALVPDSNITAATVGGELTDLEA